MQNWVAKARGGDLEAFGRLVERFEGMVYGTTCALVRNAHDAEDLAQDAFLQAWRELSVLQDDRRFPAWLYRIARNRCLDFLRRTRREGMPVSVSEASADAAPDRVAERAELRAALHDALESLSEVHRLTTTLFYLHGQSIEDIAEYLSVPPGTVKRRLHDSRKQLRKRMAAMAEDLLQPTHPACDIKRQVMERIVYWERFRGSPEEKVAHVKDDGEWRRLLQLEQRLAPLPAEARAIRTQIARLEACHERYIDSVQAVLTMIAEMKPGEILDCNQACLARRREAAELAQALDDWAQGQDAHAVAGWLGARSAAKTLLVRHVVGKLRDNAYRVYPDEEEDFDTVESRIQHLEICNFNWPDNVRITLEEIGAGRRLYPWHTPEGYNACGDAPDPAPRLQAILREAAAWADGAPAGAEWRERLSEPTPVQRWLVGSLCKHIASQHHQDESLRAFAGE